MFYKFIPYYAVDYIMKRCVKSTNVVILLFTTHVKSLPRVTKTVIPLSYLHHQVHFSYVLALCLTPNLRKIAKI